MKWSALAKRIDQIFKRNKMPTLQAIWFFGSRARGDALEKSDLDIAVYASKKITNLKRFEIAQCLALELGYSVDVIDLRQVTPDLGAHIVSENEKVFYLIADEKIQAEIDSFAAALMARYCNLNEERREIICDILKRESVYGR